MTDGIAPTETIYSPRSACRAVLLTPENEVLLIKISDPSGTWTGWITPGGGIDAGETHHESLACELREELGYAESFTAEKLWHRTTRFIWSGVGFEQTETFYLVPTHKFEISESLQLSETEKAGFKENRWWKVDDIAASREEFAPRKLAELLAEVIQTGAPKSPFEVF